MDNAAEICELILDHRHAARHRFFVGYALSLLRRAKWYAAWRSFLSYFRKFRMVALIARIASILFAVLQTSALVLLSTALFLIVIPILSAFMLGILLTALLESRKSNRYLRSALREKQVYVLFLSKRQNGFFYDNVRRLSEEEHCAVIVVSPYWISGKGLYSNHFFCTLRREDERVYLVRRYYFYQIKKHVLDEKTAYVY